MKIALVFAFCFTFVFGSVPRNRFDPCIFIDCTKLITTTKSPVITTKISNNLGNGLKPNELQNIKSQLVRLS